MEKQNMQKKTRVLVSGFTSNYGGVESFIYNHYSNMENDNIQIDILTHTQTPAYKKEMEDLGGRFFYIPSRNRNPLQYYREAHTFFETHGKEYDVYWCNKCMLNNIDFLRYAHQYKIPIRILHSHNSSNMDVGVKGKVMQWMHEFHKTKIGKYATDYWACSDFAAEWMFSTVLKKGYKYSFIPNSVMAEQFRFNRKVEEEMRQKLGLSGKFVIGHIGRFNYQKNHAYLLKIFQKVYEKKDNSILVLIGTGELEETIKAMVKEMNLEDQVLFLGVRHDIPEVIQVFDCFVLPSRFEGLPVVAIEAQAAGIPCVLSQNGITKQVKIVEKLTFLSLEQGIEEWAEAILDMENHKTDTYELIRNQGFDVKEAASRIHDKLLNRLKITM